MTRHPETGEMIWFNHATFFHVSTLEKDIREKLIRELGEENLPTNTYYGDGCPIEDSVLEALREAYQAEKVAFPWKRGDVLLLDNMLVAHGRNPYVGPRRICVTMSDPYSRS
jgi:alpha-ketoglutarate-dependent taurine dioxygenase